MGREARHRVEARARRRREEQGSGSSPSLDEVAQASPAEVDRILRDWDLHARGLLHDRDRTIVSHLLSCRTPALGGTLHLCQECGDHHAVYRSCRDRHCPKCSALDSARWEEAQKARALPAPYYHTVLTVPARLRPLFRRNKRLLYGRLLSLAAHATVDLAEERLGHGARSGAVAVLHTWNRKIEYHLHVHLLVPAGGVTEDGRWLSLKEESLLPKDLLRARFRDALLKKLRKHLGKGELALEPGVSPDSVRRDLDLLQEIDWIVFARRTLKSAGEKIGYLARYTSKVALSNDRILHYDGTHVTIATKNGETVTLHALEFCRRFVSHFLPKGFVRIRHYGILSPKNVPTLLAKARDALAREGHDVQVHEEAKGGWQDLMLRLTGEDVTRCKSCGATLLVFEIRPGESLDQVLARIPLPHRARAPTPEQAARPSRDPPSCPARASSTRTTSVAAPLPRLAGRPLVFDRESPLPHSFSTTSRKRLSTLSPVASPPPPNSRLTSRAAAPIESPSS